MSPTAKEVRKLRKYEEISRKDLSTLSGININTINSMENGRATPNIETIEKLVKALGYEIKIIKQRG